MVYKIKNLRKKEEIISYRKHPFTEEDYKKIADENGLYEEEKEDYIKFMLKRFPKERDDGYATEWAYRFKTGNPKGYMDSESSEIYEEIIKKENKEISEKEKPAYFYQWGKHHKSKYGGQDGELNVYEIKNGEFVFVGSAFVQTRAMKGFESEAMDILLKEGKISKEEYDKDNGYYRRDSHNFKISSAGEMY
jgi:hypothetical protein